MFFNMHLAYCLLHLPFHTSGPHALFTQTAVRKDSIMDRGYTFGRYWLIKQLRFLPVRFLWHPSSAVAHQFHSLDHQSRLPGVWIWKCQLSVFSLPAGYKNSLYFNFYPKTFQHVNFHFAGVWKFQRPAFSSETCGGNEIII